MLILTFISLGKAQLPSQHALKLVLQGIPSSLNHSHMGYIEVVFRR